MKHLSTLFFLSLCINTTHAEVPFTWMYYICVVITNPAYHHLLPIKGMVWTDQRIIDRMYRYGNQNKATTKLIKEFFYMQADNVSFRPTILKSKPASYWKPTDIGMIMAVITAYRENKLHDDKDDTLRTALEQIILPQKKIMQKKMKTLTADIATKKEILRDITQQSRKLFTLIGQAERKPRTTLEQLNQRITEIEQLEANQQFLTDTKEPIEHEIKKFKYDLKFIDRAIKTDITELINYFIDSIKEDDYTIEHILLTLLWKISNPRTDGQPKQDFIDYFNQLKNIVNTDNLQTWIVAQPYTLQDCTDFHENFKTLDVDMREHYITQHYEQTILAQIGRSLWTSTLPPIITGAGALYTCLDGNKTEPSPDCVETSFRNFCNIVLYNAEKKIFDTKRLCNKNQKNIIFPLQLNKNLVDFYQEHQCITNLQAAKLYNAWADVLTKLSGIVYMKPERYAQRARFYEVKSLFPNMLKICNHLLFGNNQTINQLPPEKQLDILCQAVSREDFTLSWNIADANIKKNMLAKSEYVTLNFLINDTYSFDWQLKEGHSVIPAIIVT